MINFPMQYHSQVFPFYASSEEAAIYFNSMYPSYDYQNLEPTYQIYQPIYYQAPSFPVYTLVKPDC